jgi:hypothetical protein
MLKTALPMPAQPVSLPVLKTSHASVFLREVRIILEEHRRALVATSHANEPRSHSPAVRALYVPTLASEVH